MPPAPSLGAAMRRKPAAGLTFPRAGSKPNHPPWNGGRPRGADNWSSLSPHRPGSRPGSTSANVSRHPSPSRALRGTAGAAGGAALKPEKSSSNRPPAVGVKSPTAAYQRRTLSAPAGGRRKHAGKGKSPERIGSGKREANGSENAAGGNGSSSAAVGTRAALEELLIDGGLRTLPNLDLDAPQTAWRLPHPGMDQTAQETMRMAAAEMDILSLPWSCPPSLGRPQRIDTPLPKSQRLPAAAAALVPSAAPSLLPKALTVAAAATTAVAKRNVASAGGGGGGGQGSRGPSQPSSRQGSPRASPRPSPRPSPRGSPRSPRAGDNSSRTGSQRSSRASSRPGSPGARDEATETRAQPPKKQPPRATALAPALAPAARAAEAAPPSAVPAADAHVLLSGSMYSSCHSSSEDDSDVEDAAEASRKAIAFLAAAAAAPQRGAGPPPKSIGGVPMDGWGNFLADPFRWGALTNDDQDSTDRSSNVASLSRPKSMPVLPALGLAKAGLGRGAALGLESEGGGGSGGLGLGLKLGGLGLGKLDFSKLSTPAVEGNRPDDDGRQPPTPPSLIVARIKAGNDARAAAMAAGKTKEEAEAASHAARIAVDASAALLKPSTSMPDVPSAAISHHTQPSLVGVASWAIDASELKFGRRLGAGAYGEVYEAQWRRSRVAVKRLFGSHSVEDREVQQFFAEMDILSNARHDHIVRFLGGCVEPDNLCILFEFCPQSLYDLLRQADAPLPLLRMLTIARQVALGLFYLHCCKPPVLHLDLKSANVLLDAHGHAKVCDFGLAHLKLGADVRTDRMGSPMWTAPEVLKGDARDEKADTYSYAMLLFELMTRQLPYSGYAAAQVVMGVITNLLPRPELPADAAHYPPALAALMRECWAFEAKQRPDFARILDTLETIAAEAGMPFDSGLRSP